METHPDVHARPPLRDGEITERIIGAFYRVYNSLGYGYLETVYSRALRVELQRSGFAYAAEVAFPVMYEGIEVGLYRADLVVGGRVLVEVKSCRTLTRADFRQVLNYLRASRLRVGLLLHFGPTADFHRLVM